MINSIADPFDAIRHAVDTDQIAATLGNILAGLHRGWESKSATLRGQLDDAGPQAGMVQEMIEDYEVVLDRSDRAGCDFEAFGDAEHFDDWAEAREAVVTSLADLVEAVDNTLDALCLEDAGRGTTWGEED